MKGFLVMPKIDKKDRAENILDTPFPEIYGSGAILLKHSQAEIDEMRSAEIKKRFEAICNKEGMNLKSLNPDFKKYLFVNHPAFQEKKKKKGAGRPPKRNGFEGYKLYVDVQEYLAKNKGGDKSDAFEFLVKSKKWELEPESLDSYYHSIINTNPFIKWDKAGFGKILDKKEMRKDLLSFLEMKPKAQKV
jgi:hypothetical protein